jgi:hypothetical protein
MISKIHFFAAVLAGVVICSVAGAQVRSGDSSARRPPVHPRAASRASASSTPAPASASMLQSSGQTNVIHISASGRVSSFFVPDARSFSLDSISGVPGLGFDFPHLAAISGAAGNPSFQFGRDGRRGQGTFVPILFGGYPYYYDDTGADQGEQPAVQQTQPQPQIIVIQQPVSAQQSADSANVAGNDSASAPAPQEVEPVPDVGDFILVRRDGRILFASVFSVVGAQLQYVTPEGIRRTLAMADLDAGATQQMNEARGTEVQFHN